jgi:hypothetical protein
MYFLFGPILSLNAGPRKYGCHICFEQSCIRWENYLLQCRHYASINPAHYLSSITSNYNAMLSYIKYPNEYSRSFSLHFTILAWILQFHITVFLIMTQYLYCNVTENRSPQIIHPRTLIGSIDFPEPQFCSVWNNDNDKGGWGFIIRLLWRVLRVTCDKPGDSIL